MFRWFYVIDYKTHINNENYANRNVFNCLDTKKNTKKYEPDSFIFLIQFI